MTDLAIMAAGITAIIGLVIWARRMEAREDRLEQVARAIGDEERRRRDVEALIDVTPRGNLVSQRGVELPEHPAWSHLDVILTLADVEAL